MIGWLNGIVQRKEANALILDVGGVGYRVFCSQRILDQLPPVGASLQLEIETLVREDHIHLYGFESIIERDCYRLLITVQGVGAKMALAILSMLTPEDIARAILAEDRAMLTRAEGVGPKLAQRIIGELKDKPGLYIPADPVAASAGSSLAKSSGTSGHDPAQPTPAQGDTPFPNISIADALSALSNLGYGRAEAYQAVHRALDGMEVTDYASPDALTRALIGAALKEMAKA